MTTSFLNQSEQRGLMLRRLFILFAAMVIGLIMAGVAAMFIGAQTTARLRVLTIIQDMLIFFLPAMAAALLSSRLPARFLQIDRGFNPAMLIVAVVLMVVSLPFQNRLIAWNKSLTLPASMAPIEHWMQQSETAAQASINMMMGGTTTADLVMGVLIVGIFAALCEEIFFRGALQRILQGNKRNATAAIWIAAVIFSAFHMQFYGFVPRLLLGALFGYLAWWSGSLWLPVIVHALNNSVVVVTEWMARCRGVDNAADTFGAETPWLVTVSGILVAICLYALYRLSRGKNEVSGQ